MAGRVKFSFFITVTLFCFVERARSNGHRGPRNVNDSKSEEMDLSGEQLFLLEFLNREVPWEHALADTKSDAFLKEASKMEKILGTVLNTSSGVFSWNVFQLSKNSNGHSARTIFSVHVETTANWSIEQLTDILEDAVENGTIGRDKMAHITVELDSYLDGISTHTSTTPAVFMLATTEASFPNESSRRAISPVSTELTVPISQLSTRVRQVSTTPTTSQIIPVSAESIVQGISPVLNTPGSSISAAAASNERSGTSVLTHTTITEELTTRKTTIPADTKIFVVSMKMNGYKYVPEMVDSDSKTFRETAGEIEKALSEIFKKELKSSFLGIKVIKLEPGSVIVINNIYVSSSSNYKSSDVQNTITNSAGSGELQHMQVGEVTVREDKEDESKDLTSKSTFVYILYGAGAFLGIVIIVVAVSKYRGYKKRSQVQQINANT